MTVADGARVAATFYSVPAANPPGLVLVHGAGADRHAWESFAARAQRAGFACIAFDLRGHGETKSPEGKPASFRNFKPEDWRDVLSDIDAAKKALIERGARANAIAVIGASIGANLALEYAIHHAEISAIVLVSPGLDFKGIQTKENIQRYGKRPALLMTSQGDSYSASSCASLKSVASGLCELREYQGAAHGTDILEASTTAAEDILLWLGQILPPK